MKTHEAAKVLSLLASALRSAPNQYVEELSEKGRRVELNSVDVPRALGMLVALSHFDKSQWVQVIEELRLPVDIRARDASRDIMWKILKHLEGDPEARYRLTNAPTKQRSQTSPELAQALQILLKNE